MRICWFISFDRALFVQILVATCRMQLKLWQAEPWRPMLDHLGKKCPDPKKHAPLGHLGPNLGPCPLPGNLSPNGARAWARIFLSRYLSSLQWHYADCSLRQGVGGTEFARFGSRTCFLRWFYKHSQTYFGQKTWRTLFFPWNMLSRSQKRRF